MNQACRAWGMGGNAVHLQPHEARKKEAITRGLTDHPALKKEEANCARRSTRGTAHHRGGFEERGSSPAAGTHRDVPQLGCGEYRPVALGPVAATDESSSQGSPGSQTLRTSWTDNPAWASTIQSFPQACPSLY